MGGSSSNKSDFEPDEREKRERLIAQDESDKAAQETADDLTKDFQRIYMRGNPFMRVKLAPISNANSKSKPTVARKPSMVDQLMKQLTPEGIAKENRKDRQRQRAHGDLL